MRKVLLLSLIVIMLISMPLLTSCNGTEPDETVSPTATAATGSPSPTAQANWWDKYGEPQYGGTLNLQTPQFWGQWDTNITFPSFFLYEPLFNWDYTIDHENVYSYTNRWIPPDYWTGNLAESWEWQDPATIVIHLKEGIKWQNKEPVNGREFTAYDVEYNYHRLMGLGSGFTEPQAPTMAGWFSAYEMITALDNYTVEFKFKNPSMAINNITIFDILLQNFAPPELIEEVGHIDDWRQVVSTGPWMITDYVTNSLATLVRNPDYWAYDERYPENQLPYLDEVHILYINDTATAISALRSGKIDILSQVEWQLAKTITDSNPELLKAAVHTQEPWISWRYDVEPFDDINVRKALNLAIDRELIAETHFGGTADGLPCGIMLPQYKGWVLPYDEWPEDLQAEYSYNPDKARQMLADAGYPDGFKTSTATASSYDVTLLEIMKAQFMDIGVDLEIQILDEATLMAMYNANQLESGYYQWSPAGQPPPTALLTISGSGYRTHRAGDETYLAMVEEFNKAASLEEAQELAIEADLYYLSQHWSTPVCPAYNYTFWQPYLKGYEGERNTLGYLGTPSQGALNWARLWITEE